MLPVVIANSLVCMCFSTHHVMTSRPVRIVNVASAAHQFGKIDFDSFRNPKNYQEWPFYGQR